MSANDIRELENQDLIPAEAGGDLLLVNGNMLPLEMAGAYAQQSTSTGGQDESKSPFDGSNDSTLSDYGNENAPSSDGRKE